MTFVPSLNCPRFLRSSTRSKRFRTFRFAVIVLAPFRLRCCDINAPASVSEIERQRYGVTPLFQLTFCLSRVLGKKLKNTLLVRLADSAFGDESGNQLPRRHIKSKIGCGTGLRRHTHFDLLSVVPSIGVAHFFRTTFFD